MVYQRHLYKDKWNIFNKVTMMALSCYKAPKGIDKICCDIDKKRTRMKILWKDKELEYQYNQWTITVIKGNEALAEELLNECDG